MKIARHVRITPVKTAGSSSGRTSVSGTESPGSNPGPAAARKGQIPSFVRVFFLQPRWFYRHLLWKLTLDLFTLGVALIAFVAYHGYKSNQNYWVDWDT